MKKNSTQKIRRRIQGSGQESVHPCHSTSPVGQREITGCNPRYDQHGSVASRT